jgi:hypothetical protein
VRLSEPIVLWYFTTWLMESLVIFFLCCLVEQPSVGRKADLAQFREILRIDLFEDCSAFTRVTACTHALSPYIVTRIPKASANSSPP